MQSAQSSVSGFPTSLAQRRQALLQRAAQVMLHDGASDAASPRELMLSQCLVAALEELKMVEEECVAQSEAIRAAQSEAATKIQFLTSLFETAPCALLLTTPRGVILNANHAAGALTTRSPYYLEGKPLATVIVKEKRDEFRTQLDRVIEAGGVADWHFMLDRQTNVPITVSSTICITTAGPGASQSLYWAIRPV